MDIFGDSVIDDSEVTPTPVAKKPGLFDIIGDINDRKNDLRGMDWFESTYNPHMINRVMSTYRDTCEIANLVNTQLFMLDKDIQYHFYLIMVRRSKRFAQMPKKVVSDVVSTIMKYYGISFNVAKDLEDLHNPDEISYMEEFLQIGGKSKKSS
jgi:hypothetical protein